CGGGGHDSGHADHAQFLEGQLEHHLLLLWVMKLQWLTALIRRLPVCPAGRRRRRSLARPRPQWRAAVLLATARPEAARLPACRACLGRPACCRWTVSASWQYWCFAAPSCWHGDRRQCWPVRQQWVARQQWWG